MDVKYYRLTATLKAPLAIQQDRQSHSPGGLDYLPGSSLRGALAAKFLREGGSPDDVRFRSLFLEHPACFPNLFPADDSESISRVLPLTTWSCKRQPGFKTDGHGIRDTLVSITCNREFKELGPDNLWKCHCKQDLKPFTGYWNGDVNHPKKCEVTKEYRRHTGIDRQTGTVAEGIFYTTQAISDYRQDVKGNFLSQQLSGGTFLTEEQFAYLIEIASQGPLFVGADRSRGYGEIKLEVNEAASPTFNIPAWNEAFQKRFQEIMGKALPTGVYFSVTLESPVILMDRYLRPTTELELNLEGIKTVLKVARSLCVRGWHACWKIPKPDDLALAAGSVYLFRYEGQDLSSLNSYLQNLIITGIGCRTSEGFGRLSLCDPLHLEDFI